MEHYSAVRKDEALPFAMTRTNLESIMLSEISRSEKAKKLYDFTHMGDIKLELRDTYNCTVVTRAKEVRESKE